VVQVRTGLHGGVSPPPVPLGRTSPRGPRSAITVRGRGATAGAAGPAPEARRDQVRGASRHGDLAISRTGCVRSARRLGPQPRHAVCGRPLPPHPSSRRIARRVRRDRSHERQGVR
jgi:hypothetical protein